MVDSTVDRELTREHVKVEVKREGRWVEDRGLW